MYQNTGHVDFSSVKAECVAQDISKANNFAKTRS